MKTVVRKRVPPSLSCIYPILIILVCLCMSVGYASVNKVSMSIDGDALTVIPNNVFISETSYLIRDNALSGENASINEATQTVLSSNITLQPNELSSQVSIKVVFYNNTINDYFFRNVTYEEGIEGTYNNQNITYTYNNKDKKIISGDYLEVIITFSYAEDADMSQNQLSSILCFKFEESKEIFNIVKKEALSDSVYAYKYTGTGYQTFANDVYYFTNNFLNNKVIFGGFCWNIVRTTDTQGTKLVYSGIPIDGECNNTQLDLFLPDRKSFNSVVTSPAYVGYMYNVVYPYKTLNMSSSTEVIVYGNTFSYDVTNKVYKLNDTISFSDWGSNNTGLSSNHYTCFNTTGICTDINYIYYTSSSTAYYITISDGKSVNDAINEMLYSSNVNTIDSTMKSTIDDWYLNNLISYESYLEDTVFCGDRKIIDYGGWNPNGGSTTEYMRFVNNSANNSLICSNGLDKFTVSDELGNGALSYPIGLLSFGESNLMGSKMLAAGSPYWLMSPSYFYYSGARVRAVNGSGYIDGNDVNASYVMGIRPSISLRLGVEYLSGDGSSSSPYIIKTE